MPVIIIILLLFFFGPMVLPMIFSLFTIICEFFLVAFRIIISTFTVGLPMIWSVILTFFTFIFEFVFVAFRFIISVFSSTFSTIWSVGSSVFVEIGVLLRFFLKLVGQFLSIFIGQAEALVAFVAPHLPIFIYNLISNPWVDGIIIIVMVLFSLGGALSNLSAIQSSESLNFFGKVLFAILWLIAFFLKITIVGYPFAIMIETLIRYFIRRSIVKYAQG